MIENREKLLMQMGWKETGLWVSIGIAVVGVVISFVWSLSIGLGLFVLAGAGYFALTKIPDQ